MRSRREEWRRVKNRYQTGWRGQAWREPGKDAARVGARPSAEQEQGVVGGGVSVVVTQKIREVPCRAKRARDGTCQGANPWLKSPRYGTC